MNEQTMYTALVNKDHRYEGLFIACVKTTGIFCRPTCSARKPKRENVEFVSNTQEALRKGYRPCKTCSPMTPIGAAPDWIQPLLEQVSRGIKLRFKDYEIRELGIDPNRVRRWFQKHHAITFQAYLRSLRLGSAFGYLTEGGKVTDTAFKSEYESLSGFASAFKKLTGRAPSKIIEKKLIETFQIKTKLGPMLAASSSQKLCLLEFTDRRMLETNLIDLQKKLQATIVMNKTSVIQRTETELNEYFEGKRKDFSVPLFTPGTVFQNQVWNGLKKIPYAETRSYSEQATLINNPKAVRAVGRANGENKISIIIPCHRVIGADGKLVGYGGGIERKKWLLEHERKNRHVFKL